MAGSYLIPPLNSRLLKNSEVLVVAKYNKIIAVHDKVKFSSPAFLPQFIDRSAGHDVSYLSSNLSAGLG
jgi:hypothetical protein